MKNIKIRKLEKYDSDNYQEIGFGVYLNKEANKYCFSYEAQLEDGEGQYPLEDLLDKYSVSCVDFYGKAEIVDGKKISYVQVETSDSSLKDLISILNYATIVGKEIQNINHKGRVLLTKRLGKGKVKMNGKEYEILMLANRSLSRELDTFEFRYPEMHLESMFEKGVEITEELTDYEPKFILLDNKFAKVVCEPVNITPSEYYEEYFEDFSMTHISFVFDLKGFVKVEKNSKD